VVDHVADDLELLLVHVSARLEANDMLVLVDKSVVAEAELTSALIRVRNMRDEHCSAAFSFDLL
jgi:hypothetical protein